jgi:hypothetical protein
VNRSVRPFIIFVRRFSRLRACLSKARRRRAWRLGGHLVFWPAFGFSLVFLLAKQGVS